MLHLDSASTSMRHHQPRQRTVRWVGIGAHAHRSIAKAASGSSACTAQPVHARQRSRYLLPMTVARELRDHYRNHRCRSHGRHCHVSWEDARCLPLVRPELWWSSRLVESWPPTSVWKSSLLALLAILLLPFSQFLFTRNGWNMHRYQLCKLQGLQRS